MRAHLVAALLLVGAVRAAAHDQERTRIGITFERDGSFVLDVANDPNWLLLRLERFAGERADLKVGPYEDQERPAAGGDLQVGPAMDAARDRRLAQLGPVFIDRVVLFVDGHEVRPTSAEYEPPAVTEGASHAGTDVPANGDIPASGNRGLARYRLRGRMPVGAKSLRWFYGLVIDPYPLTVRHAGGDARTVWVSGEAWSDTVDLAGRFRAPTRLEVAAEYLQLGYTHILPRGVDHILFVIGLLLLNVRLRPILMQVTAFTVAHSMTLALAIYGIVSLPSRLVEPLIALSIAYVAVENLLTRELKPWRLALVFGFGLLHGMGFAGVLRELDLPRSELFTALLSFNVGVEAGQLTVIAFAALCVVWYRHRDWYHYRIVMPVSALIASVGMYWTVARIAGPN